MRKIEEIELENCFNDATNSANFIESMNKWTKSVRNTRMKTEFDYKFIQWNVKLLGEKNREENKVCGWNEEMNKVCGWNDLSE